jgi:hypothetical protein
LQMGFQIKGGKWSIPLKKRRNLKRINKRNFKINPILQN